MPGMEAGVADAIAGWAAENPYVRRVWALGNRINDAYRPDSALDIAVELEPVGDSEETLTRWLAHAAFLKSQLQSRVHPQVCIAWFDPDGGTPALEARPSEGKVLIYERTSEP